MNKIIIKFNSLKIEQQIVILIVIFIVGILILGEL